MEVALAADIVLQHLPIAKVRRVFCLNDTTLDTPRTVRGFALPIRQVVVVTEAQSQHHYDRWSDASEVCHHSSPAHLLRICQADRQTRAL